MSNSLANNAVLPGLAPEFYIAADKEGFALQGQVPKKIQTYSGAGGESIVPNGGEILLITGAMAGTLTIDFTDNQDFNNMIGRSLTIVCTDEHVGVINIDITGGVAAREFLSSVTAETGDVATIATLVQTTCTIYFVSPQYAGIIHGTGVTIA